MFAELRELLRSGAIRRHQLGAKYLLTPTSFDTREVPCFHCKNTGLPDLRLFHDSIQIYVDCEIKTTEIIFAIFRFFCSRSLGLSLLFHRQAVCGCEA